MSTWSDDRAAAANAVSLWISVWQRESGPDRADARIRAQSAIRYFSRFHRDLSEPHSGRQCGPEPSTRADEQAWHEKQRLTR